MNKIKQALIKVLPQPILSCIKRFRASRRLQHVSAGSAQEVFTRIKKEQLWGSGESVSGGGSTTEFTAALRRWLPRLFSQFNVKTLVDIPCGDFKWMQLVPMDGIRYIGGDIVNELIVENQSKYDTAEREFIQVNLANDKLPVGDLMICKDCLIHLEHRLALAALSNIKRSGTPYILLTTYPEQTKNLDILTGDTWRVNMLLPPFNLPPPLEQISEGMDADFDKMIALWRSSDLPS